MSSIGENIRDLREKNDMSQAELAAKIGKSRAAVSQYEHGDTIPRMGVIEEMARVFRVPKSEIIESNVNYMMVNLMSDDERELIELYRALSPRGQQALMSGLRDYIESA